MLTEDFVKQAYIELVRTVVLVDENFLTIEGLCSRLLCSAQADVDPIAATTHLALGVDSGDGTAQAGPDPERGSAGDPCSPSGEQEHVAVTPPPGSGSTPSRGLLELEAEQQLWSASRARNWACDVVNEISDSTVQQLRAADLIVLDYHLAGDASTDDSIRIVDSLSRSPGASLVIVYTNEPRLADAKLRVAATLRGVKNGQDDDDDLIASSAESFRREYVSEAGIASFLSDAVSENAWPELEAFARKALGDPSASVDRCRSFIGALYEDYVTEAYSLTGGPEVRRVHLSAFNEAPHWVQCANVFVVFVSKKEFKGEAVFAQLSLALEAWNPPFLVASLALARRLIVEGGFDVDASILEDEALHVGWIYHALESASVSAPSRSLAIRGLFSRALSAVHSRVLDSLSAIAEAAVPSGDTGSTPEASPHS